MCLPATPCRSTISWPTHGHGSDRGCPLPNTDHSVAVPSCAASHWNEDSTMHPVKLTASRPPGPDTVSTPMVSTRVERSDEPASTAYHTLPCKQESLQDKT